MPSKDYLPADADLDPSIPSPESVLGWEPGDWRIHHDALVRYMYLLAEQSDRVSIKVTGYTYEHRPLLQLVITSKENQAKLETLRQAHLDGSTSGDTSAPLVVWMGYSVHGNEASGSNAAPIVAWYLAASRSDEVDNLLDNSIIIIDPSLNPDGLDRFASWSNSHVSKNPVSDWSGRVHHENWPGGRTNHYLFDLNRDWLPLVHPESRARMKEFHRWLPHVLTDHHETGHDGFFFQPGVPTRQNPLTTDENLTMTRALAKYHASVFDEAGVMYFTEDTYDDYYYGKGSTYPDINGSIGILFEQPSVYGAVIDRDNGPLTFTQAIHNQVRTSLSSLKGAHELQDELKHYQSGFFKAMQKRAGKAGFKAWVVGDGGDPDRASELMNIFRQHQVEFQTLSERVNADGQVFEPGHAWVIPANQRQFGLIQAMMEKRTQFKDETFYDVSAWSLPLAYNLPFATVAKVPASAARNQTDVIDTPAKDAVAWIISWQQLHAPAALQSLLDTGATVRAASKPFTIGIGSQSRTFSEGSLVVLPGIQDTKKSGEIYTTIQKISEQGVQVVSVDTHLTTTGPGLGTSHFERIQVIKPLLIDGPGTRSYDVGEVWYQMDQQLGIAPVMLDMNRLGKTNLADYTHLIMADGRYSDIGSKLKARIADWIKKGGVLIATQRAATWSESLCFQPDKCKEEKKDKKDKKADDEDAQSAQRYADFDAQKARLTIGGAIVATVVDNSHPVAWGYDDTLAIFRRGTTILKTSDNPFATPLHYQAKPLISGFIGDDRLAEMSQQPAVIAERHGDGAIIRFANNPLFRGFWRGTERLWVNALYFGPLLNSTVLPK